MDQLASIADASREAQQRLGQRVQDIRGSRPHLTGRVTGMLVPIAYRLVDRGPEAEPTCEVAALEPLVTIEWDTTDGGAPQTDDLQGWEYRRWVREL
jgi:hypothetical protein